MASTHRVKIMFRNGGSYIINLSKDSDTLEGALSFVTAIQYAIDTKTSIFRLTNADNKVHSVFRVEDITCAYHFSVDVEEEKAGEERDKENKQIHAKLLKQQLRHYEELHDGDSWKNKKEPWE